MEKQLKEKLKHLEDRHKAERNAVVRLQHQLRHKVLDVTSSGGGGGNDDDDDDDEKTRSKTSQNSPQQFGPAIARAQSCFSRRRGRRDKAGRWSRPRGVGYILTWNLSPKEAWKG